ncbi:MAG: peptidylprolyl isomerase [Acidobacteriota bacterium]
MKLLGLLSLSILLLTFSASAQVPLNTQIQLLKAEDARRYDAALEKLLSDASPAVRKRAALAAGRIGDDKAVDALAGLLGKDPSNDVRTMAAFALGEIESIKGADAILIALGSKNQPADAGSADTRARAVEAAGKIAAASPKDPKSKALSDAILNVLMAESEKQTTPSTEVVRLALTAALRARPAGADEVVRKYLAFTDPGIVGDALNTLTRLRAKNANHDARDLLATSVNAVVRAGAARVLGAAEDKDAADILIKAATTDTDLRVRVSAIRALGGLKGAGAGDKLLDRGEALFRQMAVGKTRNPPEKNELLEIASALGRVFQGTKDEGAVSFLTKLRASTRAEAPEVEIAFARIAPKKYVDSFEENSDWKSLSAEYQGLAELANLDASTEPEAKLKARLMLVQEIARRFTSGPHQDVTAPSRPDLVRSFAAFKSENTSNIFRPLMEVESDIFVRAAIAETLGEQPATKENVEELKKAFTRALIADKEYDDAQLAILDALAKLDKKEAVGTLLIALNAPDYLVRKKAFDLLDDQDLQKEFPGIPTSLEVARSRHEDHVQIYTGAYGTKLGQITNSDADYRRAASRKNGSAKAVITTEKGNFTIEFLPEDAPLTVDNFVKLARANYFNGVEVHRVVPNFVMQDGDPRGDGNGGPGWSIRCEINMVPYERGAVGMALSGKDTGGSQWFVTHSPQPHLDGGYTVFGKVNESDMKVVDNIVRGDKIVSVKIVEGVSPLRTRRTRGKK